MLYYIYYIIYIKCNIYIIYICIYIYMYAYIFMLYVCIYRYICIYIYTNVYIYIVWIKDMKKVNVIHQLSCKNWNLIVVLMAACIA